MDLINIQKLSIKIRPEELFKYPDKKEQTDVSISAGEGIFPCSFAASLPSFSRSLSDSLPSVPTLAH